MVLFTQANSRGYARQDDRMTKVICVDKCDFEKCWHKKEHEENEYCILSCYGDTVNYPASCLCQPITEIVLKRMLNNE